MIARVLDMPDDPPAIAAWLDAQLVGGDLHELVAELTALHAPAAGARPARPPTAGDAATWLGGLLPDVLERGTAALPADRLSALLTSPWLLPALQELIFVDGKDHWHRAAMAANPPPRMTADDILRQRSEGPPQAFATSPVPAATVSRAGDDGRAVRHLVTLVGTLAAGLFVAVAWWSWLRPAGPQGGAWGWNRPDVFAATAADAYLERLATAAGEWSQANPQSEAALAVRLRELLAGCDRLIAAPHEPLAASDRDWLLERCRAWREKIVGHADALAASHDVAAVRAAADATVEKLMAALRTRAEQVRSSGGVS